MLVNLKVYARKNEQQQVTLELSERLPTFLTAPCHMTCQFKVEAFPQYYLLSLENQAKLIVNCQRCLKDFSYDYNNQSLLTICPSEELAEKMMGENECIVSLNNQIDLKTVLTDELYLYAPAFHPQSSDCDNEVAKFIQEEA